ncbi:MAG TPA: hypothetical protein VF993_13790 [Myxococcales bacterium]
MSYRSALFLMALSSAAAAQQPQPETSGIAGQNQPNASGVGQSFSDPSQLFSGRAGAFFGLAFQSIGGEGLYASTVINTEFNLGDVGIGLALPLNLLVKNNDNCCGPDPAPDGSHPHSRDYKTYSGIIRRRDWDEWQSYTKLVRFVRYGHKRDPVYFTAGQLWGASIGHGTLVSRYSNSLNLDHTKFGLALDFNSDYVGLETLTDSVGAPSLLATRAYVRPLGGTPILRGWALGVTFATDRTAPRALSYNPDGSVAQDPQSGTIKVASQDAIYAGGVDTEFEVLHNSLISLIPYVDLNRIAGAGNGLHAGVLADIYFPIPLLAVNLEARLEYRMMQPGYIPEYFDQTYDLGRIQYAVAGTCAAGVSPCPTAYQPKYVAASDAHRLAADPRAVDRKGYYGELSFGFAGFLQIGGLYQDYEGDPQGASLGLFATFPKIELVKISAYYLRKNMKGTSDAFAIDERSLLAGALAYKMFGPLYLRVEFQRRWQLRPDAKQIEAVDSFSAGLATFISF